MRTQANKKKRGLGKGLDSLMNDSNYIINDIIDKGNTSTLAIKALQAGISQPRTTFSEDSIESLSDSIKQHGILQPLIVRAISDDIYEIIAGERRFPCRTESRLKNRTRESLIPDRYASVRNCPSGKYTKGRFKLY